MTALQRITVCAVAAVLVAGTATCRAETPTRPSILFCSGGIDYSECLHLPYLREMHDAGFEVDYLETPEALLSLSPNRIEQYNVLVIYITPDAYLVGHRRETSSPERVQRFQTMIDNYVRRGGGVLLMPEEMNYKKQRVGDLTDLWGARIPMARIVEGNTNYIGRLSNFAIDVPLLYTPDVLPSPVSEGVRGIWYPMGWGGHNGGQTAPLIVDDNWTVVVKASQTAVTSAPEEISETQRIPGVECSEGVKSPPLFAVRERGKGRIALVGMFPQFSTGAGTLFTFNREVLSKGVNGKPSDFGKLLENTYRWLAAPSLENGALGGYTTRPEALLARNQRPHARELSDYEYWYKEYEINQWHRPPVGGSVYKGLIGARTAYSDGQGTVEEYAEAAKTAGLDFVVFLENFAELTKSEYEQLHEDCRTYSDPDIKLVAGYTIKANIGNHLFCFSDDEPKWPHDSLLTGPGRKRFYLQPENGNGGYTGKAHHSVIPFLLWHAAGPRNVGYYNWAGSGKGMNMEDLRGYSMAGLRYYRDGKLVEDMTDAYLTTLQSTMPPSPVSINEVTSPQELIEEVESGHALTYGQARSRKTIVQDALNWSDTYAGPNVFPSDGPVIRAWPMCYRPMTFGGEAFVTHPNIMRSELDVRSSRGLKQISIYDGRRLFRRFTLDGAQRFRETLFLNGTVMKNLVVIAEDIEGGKAISFARRSYKYDGRSMSWCGDHYNDGPMRLVHGPGGMQVNPVPVLPLEVAGFTWDGGGHASGASPLVDFFVGSRPVLRTDLGREDGGRFNQTPIVETVDEGVLATASRQDELFDERIEGVRNAWHTYGPLGGPSRLMAYTLRFKEYYPPTVGPQGNDLPIRGVRLGNRPCVFRSEITFRDSFAVESLQLISQAHPLRDGLSCHLVIGRKPDVIEQVLDTETIAKRQSFTLARGDWFALYSDDTANSHVFVVGGDPVVMQVHNNSGYGWLRLFADLNGKTVKKGDTYTLELASLNASLDVAAKDAESLRKLRAYLHQPEGMEVLRGERTTAPGLVDIAPEDYAVELEVPKPSEALNITLPIRVTGLNRNWTAGLYQKEGYVAGAYGTGEDRYRAVGLDLDGSAHVPLYPEQAERTHVMVGHPIVADKSGRDVMIQVTRMFDDPVQWHISVNNPTSQPIRTTLKQAMELPGLCFGAMEIALDPGEYRVLR